MKKNVSSLLFILVVGMMFTSCTPTVDPVVEKIATPEIYIKSLDKDILVKNAESSLTEVSELILRCATTNAEIYYFWNLDFHNANTNTPVPVFKKYEENAKLKGEFVKYTNDNGKVKAILTAYATKEGCQNSDTITIAFQYVPLPSSPDSGNGLNGDPQFPF